MLQQRDEVLSEAAPTAIEIELARRLCQLLPGLDLVRMVSSGTEATMSAIRLARGHTGRDKIIKFEGCYHGHSDSLLVKAGSGALTLGVPSSPGVPAALADHTVTLTYNDVEGVEAAFDGRDGWMTKIAAAARHLPTEDAKVGGDEREALPASVHEALAFYADSTVDYITFDKTRRQAQLDARRNSPDWEEIGEDGRGHERFVVTGNKASTALEDLERWEESRTALSADGGEESPSLTNPLTPYGMLVRALRIVADTTLMEMSQRCGMTPSYLSALEFGRKAVTNDDATSAAVFFASKGIAGTLGLLQAAIAANQAKGDAS